MLAMKIIAGILLAILVVVGIIGIVIIEVIIRIVELHIKNEKSQRKE